MRVSSAKQLEVVKEPAAVTPCLKWPGGKRWFVKNFGDAMFEHVMSQSGNYFEPFLGGGAMAFHLGLPNMHLGDIEGDLINSYVAIRDDVEDVIAKIDELREFTDEGSYYTIRDHEPEDWVEGAARLLYLNKLCFNGLYRKNKAGKFNAAYNGEPRALISAAHLRKVSVALKSCHLWHCSFGDVICMAEKGDVIYADPPYDGTFAGYSGKGFTDIDQAQLAMELECAAGQGADFFAHNSDTQLIRKLYKDFNFIPMPEKRRINRDGSGRGDAPCVLITNVDL